MKYLITGGSGFIGSHLCKSLSNDRCVVLTRNIPKTQRLFYQKQITNAYLIDSLGDFNEPVDGIINLAGIGIFDKRWSATYKAELLSSRIDTTQALNAYVQRVSSKPQVCISGSAVGIYGEQFTIVDENAHLGTGFSSQLCKLWEAEAQHIAHQGVRTCILRLGVVIGNGGMLKKTLPSVKFGVGAYFAGGSMYMPWVHIEDVIGVIQHLISTDESGVFNVVAPQQITNKIFMDALATVMHRKILCSIPEKMLCLLFGSAAREILLISQKLTPTALHNAGYNFKFKNITHALQSLVT